MRTQVEIISENLEEDEVSEGLKESLIQPQQEEESKHNVQLLNIR